MIPSTLCRSTRPENNLRLSPCSSLLEKRMPIDPALLAHVQNMLPNFLDDLAVFSQIGCGTFSKTGVDAVGDFMHQKLATLDLKVEVYDDSILGNSLISRSYSTVTRRSAPLVPGG